MVAELFHVDGRKERYDEAIRRFSHFCERAPKTGLKCVFQQERILVGFVLV